MRGLAVTALTYMALTMSAQAEDVRIFFRWAESIVIDAKLPERSNWIIIKVKDEWEKDSVPEVYRLRLPQFVLCTKFADELERRDHLSATVRLVDENKQTKKAETTVPGRLNACDWLLNAIEEDISKYKNPE